MEILLNHPKLDHVSIESHRFMDSPILKPPRMYDLNM